MGGACSIYGGGERPYRVFWGNLKKREHLEDTGIDGRIILSYIFRKWDVEAWTGQSWLKIRTGDGHI
jgi:hypothetical protein